MGPKRSGSSRAKRERLRKDFASLPALNPRVELCRYIHMARGSLDEALTQNKRGNFTSAYIELEKFFTLTLDRLPTHPSFKNPSRDPKLASELEWAEKAKAIAFEIMQDIVEKMDREEDRLLQYEMECRLFDEFDGLQTTEPSSDSVEAMSAASSPYQAVIMNTPIHAPFSAPLSVASAEDGALSILQAELSADGHVKPPSSFTDSQPLLSPLPPPPSSSSSSSFQPASSPAFFPAPVAIASAAAASLVDMGSAPPLGIGSPSDSGRLAMLEPTTAPLTLSSSSAPVLPSPTATLSVPPKPSLVPYTIPAGLFPAETLALVRCLMQKPSFHIPTPASSVFDLRFASGVETRLYKDDFHTSFAGFLSDVPSDLQLSTPAMELNRCFFVHLAIATGFHPFLLQFAFRVLVQEALRSPDCWYQELLVTVTKQADLVDANVLTFLWPVEFDAFRILFVSTQSTSPILTHFSIGAADAKEVVILCNRDHFTLLQPLRQGAHQPMRIIDELLVKARRAGCVVQENAIQRDPQRSIQRALLAAL